MNIRIVTDSTSDLPSQTAIEHQIKVVPLKVIFGQQTYLDGIDLDIDTFYQKLTNSGHFPSTSQPSPAEFYDVYKPLLADPDTHILSVHLSANLSGTYQSACIAKSMLSDDEAARVTILDSKFTCYGLGVIVLELARIVSQNGTLDQCLHRFAQIRSDIRLYFMVDTLEYLQKGGRIGKASAFIGSLLNIKPILTIDDEGFVSPVDRVRGQKNALQKLMEKLKSDFQDQPVHVQILHSQALSTAEQLATEIRAKFNLRNLEFAPIGPVIGTHVGPGAIAVIMYP
jgi:DegV family protein with EDD domain